MGGAVSRVATVLGKVADVVSPLLGVIAALGTLIEVFEGKPAEKNKTMLDIEDHIQQESESGRLMPVVEEGERRPQQDQEEYEQQVEIQRQAQEAAEREAKLAQELAAAAAEHERLAIEMEQATREHEKERVVAEKALEEARKFHEEAKAREAAALLALEQGIRPIKWPTAEEVAAAKAAVCYNPERLHFAVCGTAGSGKSSLINSLRGLSNTGADAAQVGVVETTSKITRYPDPRVDYPYARFVWYDIPGAGTLNVPDWQYFIDQGLFVFDFIVMTYDVRFTKIDVGILENCQRFNIPVFVVRSKADQHIKNMAICEGYEEEDEYKPWYQKMKPRYVEASRKDFKRNLERMVTAQENPEPLLLGQKLYIVSSIVLRGLLTSDSKKMLKDRSKIIDEEDLVSDMIKVAATRRYGVYDGISQTVVKKGKKAFKAGISAVKDSLRLGVSYGSPVEDEDYLDEEYEQVESVEWPRPVI